MIIIPLRVGLKSGFIYLWAIVALVDAGCELSERERCLVPINVNESVKQVKKRVGPHNSVVIALSYEFDESYSSLRVFEIIPLK
jgi:hypothetical protein